MSRRITAAERVRIRAGLSRYELAAAAGVDPTTVYRIEGGDQPPRMATLRKLATAMKCQVEDLIDDENLSGREAS